jgi:hypothetical protein
MLKQICVELDREPAVMKEPNASGHPRGFATLSHACVLQCPTCRHVVLLVNEEIDVVTVAKGPAIVDSACKRCALQDGEVDPPMSEDVKDPPKNGSIGLTAQLLAEVCGAKAEREVAWNLGAVALRRHVK